MAKHPSKPDDVEDVPKGAKFVPPDHEPARDDPEKAALQARVAALEAELAAAKGGRPRMAGRPVHAPPPEAAKASAESVAEALAKLGAMAVGEWEGGKNLYTVSLTHHKSLATDPEKGIGVLVDALPVWATSEGDAWFVFKNHNGILGTEHSPVIAVQPEPEGGWDRVMAPPKPPQPKPPTPAPPKPVPPAPTPPPVGPQPPPVPQPKPGA